MPKAPTPVSLLEEVRANIPARVRRTWESGLSEELRVELEGVRDDWRAGRLGDVSRNAIARAISATLTARGSAVHYLTVAEWLKD